MFPLALHAQTVYRCPGPPVQYVDDITPTEAKERQCRVIENAPATVLAPPRAEAPAPPTSRHGPPERQPRSRPSVLTGSAFLVAEGGLLLTNNHVVAKCDSLTASQAGRPPQSAVVVRRDAKLDLALVKTASMNGTGVTFRAHPVRPGEQVIALGFPLRGLLATEVNVSTGTVSALAGIGNDQTRLQIQAPVQPGNSGGPLIDSTGAIVGVVVSKLDDIAVASATGAIPQNINFAVKGSVALTFLQTAGVRPAIASVGSRAVELLDVIATVREAVHLLECKRAG